LFLNYRLHRSLKPSTNPVRELTPRAQTDRVDEDTFAKLSELGRYRMATIQELADEAFADVLKKTRHPGHLKDALRKSAAPSPRCARQDTQENWSGNAKAAS